MRSQPSQNVFAVASDMLKALWDHRRKAGETRAKGLKAAPIWPYHSRLQRIFQTRKWEWRARRDSNPRPPA